MTGSSGGMRAGPAARDSQFRGIDPQALGHLIRQVRAGTGAIKEWLGSHRPPPGVPGGGYRQAAEVEQWATEQLGMLARRHSYALTHPDQGGGVQAPPPPPRSGSPRGSAGGGGPGGGVRAPGPPRRGDRTGGSQGSHGSQGAQGAQGAHGGSQGSRRPPLTGRGAGSDLGNFATRPAAERAARADALAATRALRDGREVPEPLWRHLRAEAGDPDYTEALYERLGPAGAVGLIKAAKDDEARLAAIRGSLGTASHHVPMNAAWLRAMLAEAGRVGVRTRATEVITRAELSPRGQDALARLGIETGSPEMILKNDAKGP